MRTVIPAVLALLLAVNAGAEEPADAAENNDAETAAPAGDGIESPRTMSGMSILGNEEAPKALVIIPWKSSELGDEIGLENTLDDLARPVDKEVFLRELRYHEIRAGIADGASEE